MNALLTSLERSLLLLSILLLSCYAVLQGDEQYASMEGGRFWTFHEAGLSVINPDSCKIEQEVRIDRNGDFLPRKWADGVYMEDDNVRVVGEGRRKGGYVLINSGVTMYDRDDNPFGEVIVFSTADDNQVHARLPLYDGGRYHRSYALTHRKEYWSQSSSGKLYSLPLDVLTDLNENAPMKWQQTLLGQRDDDDDGGGIHGPILWDEDSFLTNTAYITSPGAIHVIDLETKKQVGLFNYSVYLNEEELQNLRGGGYGRGMAYTSRNRHLFVACGWYGPILEFVLRTPRTFHFVYKHVNMSGHIHEHEEGVVIVVNKHQSKIHILQANGQEQPSSEEFHLDIPGNPDEASFYTTGNDNNNNDKKTTTVCMPLTENINRGDRYARNGSVACDGFSCGPPHSPEDVAAGMCLYNETDNSRTLLRAPLADFQKVLNGEAPYLSRCPRCKIRESYRGGDICTCTPHCGSCGTPTYNKADLFQTGVRCFSLDTLLLPSDATTTTLIAGAGAVMPEPPSFWQPPCSYGWTHRSSKRGGRYHASVAHIPTNSLQIVDMKTETWQCEVDLPGKPDRVLYVPPQPFVLSEQEETLKQNGIIVMNVILACTVIFIVCIAALHRGQRTNSKRAPGLEISSMTTTTQQRRLELSSSSAAVDEPIAEPLPEIS